MDFSLYIHVPFCLSRCTYCSFYSGEPLDRMDAFTCLLPKEAALRGREGSGGAAATVYFGGGTPSLLGTDRLAALLAGIGRHFPPDEGAEITVETNPASRCDFASLRLAGFTRISLGVQALRDSHLRRLGRPHTAAEALEAVRNAVSSGISVSADLLYGFEGLAPEDLTRGVESLAAHGVDHLSAYSLEEPRGALQRGRMAAAGLRPAPAEEEERQWLALRDALVGAGFVQYEVSNFCRPGRMSRHNLAYWTGSPYVGLGPGAHGFRPSSGPFGERHANAPDLAAWSEALERGALPPGTREVLTREEAWLERLFLALRMAEPFNAEALANRFGADPSALCRELSLLARRGDLDDLSGGLFHATSSGMRRADGLALWISGRVSHTLDSRRDRD